MTNGPANRPDILLIEDNALVRESIEADLTDAGYAVTAASDSGRVLNLLAATGADLLITDILMPGKDGLETIREVRRHNPCLKIVAISGGSRDGAALIGLAAQVGADATLKKPFSPPQLIDLVREVLAPSR